MVREDQIGVLIEQEVLEARIKELGEQISKEYAGKELKLVCILKGGAMFMTQLAKYITVPVTMDFMILSSTSCVSITLKSPILKFLLFYR